LQPSDLIRHHDPSFSPWSIRWCGAEPNRFPFCDELWKPINLGLR